MGTMMKWIKAEPAGTSDSGKTRKWNVVSSASNALLGTIYWWPGWRQYVFEPNGAARIIFEEDCLRDIAAFVEQATKDHKAAKRSGQ
jgi:cell wall-associated NlpC family hydrolase